MQSLPGSPRSCYNLALGGLTNRGGACLEPLAGRLVSKGAVQQVVTSGSLPPVVRDIVLYRLKFAISPDESPERERNQSQELNI